MRKKNIHDPIWGRIDLEDHEWRLLQMPLFQRLRRVHQLGMTMLVFPGTTHTRFEHSLGACHAAGQIAQRLADDDETSVPFGEDDRRLARTAALLHDIGHGPFSHVSDEFLGDKGHEEFGAMIVERHPEVAEAMGGDVDLEAVAAVLRETASRSVVRDIVSGPIDADKVDYLLRDSHYAGVEQGRFDYVRFFDQAIAVDASPYSQLGVRWGGLWAVEGMLLARHHMHRTVYGHRNRLITDFMLQRGLKDLKDRGLIPEDLLSKPTAENYDAKVEAYGAWDDWSVFSTGTLADGIAGEMFTRLRNHRLLKLLVYLEGEELHRLLAHPTNTTIVGLGKKLKEIGPATESELAREIGVPPQLLFVRLEDPKQPLARPDDPNLADADIIIRAPDGDRQQLQMRTEVLFGAGAVRPRMRLLVYAPIGLKEDPALSVRTQDAVIRMIQAAVREVRQ